LTADEQMMVGFVFPSQILMISHQIDQQRGTFQAKVRSEAVDDLLHLNLEAKAKY